MTAMTTARTKKGRMRGTWITLALTIALLAILLSQTDLRAIATGFSNLSPAAAAGGLLAWGGMNWLRAIRFRMLVHSRTIPLGRLFSIVNVQNLLASFTPGRAGELSYVVLLRQDGRVPGTEGLAGLVVARVQDLVLACGLAFGALLAVRRVLPPGSGHVLLTAAAFFAVSVLIALQLARLSETGARMAQALLRRTRLGRWGPARSAAEKVIHLHEHIARERSVQTGLRLWLLTAAIWMANYAVSYIWIVGLGLPLSVGGILFVAAVSGLAGSLPVQGLAGLGTTEAGWAIPLVLMGIARDRAIAAGFCFHALAAVYLVLLGAAGALHLSHTRRIEAAPGAGK